MNEQYLNDQVELENCKFVKTVLMIIVVLYHSIKFWDGSWFVAVECLEKSSSLTVLADFLGGFHIYCFALCSGYLYSFLRNEKNRYDNWKLFVRKKFFRLIVPYIFVCLFWVVPITQFFFHYPIGVIVNKYVLATNPSQLWFLWMLFDIFLLVYPLKKLISKDIFALGISVSAFVIGTLGSLVLPNFFCIWTALTYVPYFILGMKLREKKTWFVRRISNFIYLLMFVFLLFIYEIINNQQGTLMKVLSLGIAFVLHVVGALSAFFVLQKIANYYTKWRNSGFFHYVAQRAMPVYLFHQQIIYLSIYMLNGRISALPNAILNFIIAMFVSLLISSLLLRFNITRFLIGENKKK